MGDIQTIIEAAWDNRELVVEKETQDAILQTIRMLNQGEIRVANQQGPGKWTVNEWVKKAITLYFPIQAMETIKVGPFEFHDKIPLKTGFA
ncbi:MAG TPA: 2,3,4,5-tetrahydropyridine-2,6-dicarboxylate N-succinyltransferase, partial [Saprospiraceae bacterium]|nr:2,3,4,5-tetrahydropyridine-2,6-dicarboxylate N-succinyltransferase [Saprospiraceae bacterium]